MKQHSNIRQKFFWKSSLNGNKGGKCDEPWFCQKWSSLFKSELSIHRELTKIALWINFYCHHSLKASSPEFSTEDHKIHLCPITFLDNYRYEYRSLIEVESIMLWHDSKIFELCLVFPIYKNQQSPTNSGWPMFF